MGRVRGLAATAAVVGMALTAAFATGAPTASGSVTARHAATAATTAAFAFNPPLALLDGQGANTGAAEPSIDVDTPGNVYVTGPRGVPTGGCPFWTIHPGSFNS